MPYVPRSLLSSLRLSQFNDAADQIDEEQGAGLTMPFPEPDWSNPTPTPEPAAPKPQPFQLPDWSKISLFGGQGQPEQPRQQDGGPFGQPFQLPKWESISLAGSSSPVEMPQQPVGSGEAPAPPPGPPAPSGPAPTGNLVDYARAAATKMGVDPDIFVRQIQQESGFDPTAGSPAGAKGIAQFMPGTAAQYGVDVNDPYSSLDGAARHMRDLLNMFGGDYAKALAGYNAGPGNVQQYGGVPPFEETQRYVRTILGGSNPPPREAPQPAAQDAAQPGRSSEFQNLPERQDPFATVSQSPYEKLPVRIDPFAPVTQSPYENFTTSTVARREPNPPPSEFPDENIEAGPGTDTKFAFPLGRVGPPYMGPRGDQRVPPTYTPRPPTDDEYAARLGWDTNTDAVPDSYSDLLYRRAMWNKLPPVYDETLGRFVPADQFYGPDADQGQPTGSMYKLASDTPSFPDLGGQESGGPSAAAGTPAVDQTPSPDLSNPIDFGPTQRPTPQPAEDAAAQLQTPPEPPQQAVQPPDEQNPVKRIATAIIGALQGLVGGVVNPPSAEQQSTYDQTVAGSTLGSPTEAPPTPDTSGPSVSGTVIPAALGEAVDRTAGAYGSSFAQSTAPSELDRALQQRYDETVQDAPEIVRPILSAVGKLDDATQFAVRAALGQQQAIADAIDVNLPTDFNREHKSWDLPMVGKVGIADAIVMALPGKLGKGIAGLGANAEVDARAMQAYRSQRWGSEPVVQAIVNSTPVQQAIGTIRDLARLPTGLGGPRAGVVEEATGGGRGFGELGYKPAAPDDFLASGQPGWIDRDGNLYPVGDHATSAADLAGRPAGDLSDEAFSAITDAAKTDRGLVRVVQSEGEVAAEIGAPVSDAQASTLGRLARSAERDPNTRFVWETTVGPRQYGEGWRELNRVLPRESAPASAADRYYHGTGGDFERPDAAHFDPNGLFGPGYYLTSDPRVAGSYAETRAVKIPSEANVADMQGLIRDFKDHREGLEARIATTHSNLERIQAQSEIRRIDDVIAQVEKDIALASGNTPGPNVRAVDVPRGLNLLDAEAPTDDATIAAVRRGWGQMFSPAQFDQVVKDTQATRWPFTGEELWHLLEKSTGDPTLANDILKQAGYDGIRYNGGQRIPLANEAGKPIEHQAVVVFPESMDKLTNAISGLPGGLVEGTPPSTGAGQLGRIGAQALQAAAGGGYAASQQPEATPESVARGALYGGAASVARGQLLRRFNPQMAGRVLSAVERRAGQATEQQAPETQRFYHGTAASYDKPNPVEFGQQGGLYGDKAHYLTDTPLLSDSYAQGRGYGVEDIQQISDHIKFLEGLHDADSPQVQRMIADAQDLLDHRLASAREGAQVRPADVPRDLNLLDADRIYRKPELQPMLDNLAQSAEDTNSGLAQAVRNFAGAVDEHLTGAAAGGDVYGVLSRYGKDEANRVLAAAGFDGIRYEGGNIMPITDSTGNAIKHTALAIFPESLDKITNALSGAQGGAIGTHLAADLAGGAAGGVAGYATGGTEEEKRRNALVGAAAGFLGTTAAQRLGAKAMPVIVARAVQQAANRAPAAAQATATWPERLRSVGYSAMIGPTTSLVSLTGNLGEIFWQVPKSAYVNLREQGIGAGARITAHEMVGIQQGLGEAGLRMLDALGHAAGIGKNPATALSERAANPLDKFFLRAVEAPGHLFTELPDALRAIPESMGLFREAGKIVEEKGLRGNAAAQEFDRLVSGYHQQKAAPQALQMPEFTRLDKAATDLGEKLSFQGEMGAFGKAGQRFMTNSGPVGTVTSHIVMPFWKTPINMAAQVAEKTPLGVMAKQSRAAKEFDVAAGTALLAGMVYVAGSGAISGSGPDDPEKRKMLQKEGWRAHSTQIGPFRIPNTAFGEWQPMLDAAGEIADAHRYQKTSTNADSLATDALKRAGGFLNDMPYLRGLSDLVNALKDPGTALQNYAASLGTRLVPLAATGRTVGTATDPYERTPEQAKDVGFREAIAQRMKVGTGIKRQDVPISQDVLGEDVTNPRQGLGAVLPRYSTAQPNRIIAAFRDAGTDIPRPHDSLTVDGIKVDLTSAEQRAWQRYRGDVLQRVLPNFMDKPGYANAPTAAKQAALQILLTDASRAADEQMKRDIGAGLTKRVRDAALLKAG